VGMEVSIPPRVWFVIITGLLEGQINNLFIIFEEMYNEEDDARLLLRCAGLMFVFVAVMVFLAWAVFMAVEVLAKS
jgi:hypothetical protein